MSVADGSFRIEVRSVNARYLDARVNLPFVDAELHTEILRTLRARLERGRVELTVVAESSAAGAGVRADLPLAASYHEAIEGIRAHLGIDAPVSVDLIAAQRGVLEAAAPRESALVRSALDQGVREALDALEAARTEEGAALVDDLRRRVAALRAATSRLESAAKDDPEGRRLKIQGRIEEIFGSMAQIDPTRVAAEAAMLALRSDVHEEIVRIRSHLDRAENLFSGEGPIGRKLDFLCQEIGREVNTSGAKVDATTAVDEVLLMKAEVDKMREQAQNLE